MKLMFKTLLMFITIIILVIAICWLGGLIGHTFVYMELPTSSQWNIAQWSANGRFMILIFGSLVAVSVTLLCVSHND